MNKFIFKIKRWKFNSNNVTDPLDEVTYFKSNYPYAYIIFYKWNATFLTSKIELPLKYILLHVLKTFIKIERTNL